MPVIVNASDPHPFLPSLGNAAAIERSRAERQDIRPMEIAILNLMADKISTERQLARWLGHTPLQVRVTFVATDSYVDSVAGGRDSKNTPAAHIRTFYNAWRDIKHRKFDGLIVTGVNALQPRVELESFWPEVRAIFDWSATNTLSSLFLCWGAKAALKHFHDIDSHKGTQKTFGLFDHHIVSDKTGLLFGFPDRFSVPVSRWKNPDASAIAACAALETVAISDESGPNILAEPAPFDDGAHFYPRRVYILNHPEYEADTLKTEYLRDSAADPATPLPRHYFPDNDPTRAPVNNWRHTAHIYANWVASLYEATPYDAAQIPQPFAVKIKP